MGEDNKFLDTTSLNHFVAAAGIEGLNGRYASVVQQDSGHRVEVGADPMFKQAKPMTGCSDRPPTCKKLGREKTETVLETLKNKGDAFGDRMQALMQEFATVQKYSEINDANVRCCLEYLRDEDPLVLDASASVESPISASLIEDGHDTAPWETSIATATFTNGASSCNESPGIRDSPTSSPSGGEDVVSLGAQSQTETQSSPPQEQKVPQGEKLDSSKRSHYKKNNSNPNKRRRDSANKELGIEPPSKRLKEDNPQATAGAERHKTLQRSRSKEYIEHTPPTTSKRAL